MILDKLLEKKEVYAFIRMRKASLKKELKNIRRFPEKKREIIKQRLLARIRELCIMKQAIQENRLKKDAVNNWKLVYEEELEKELQP